MKFHSSKPKRIPLVDKCDGDSRYSFRCKCGWEVDAYYWTAQEAYDNGADFSPTGVVRTWVNGNDYEGGVDEDVSSKAELFKLAQDLIDAH